MHNTASSTPDMGRGPSRLQDLPFTWVMKSGVLLEGGLRCEGLGALWTGERTRQAGVVAPLDVAAHGAVAPD